MVRQTITNGTSSFCLLGNTILPKGVERMEQDVLVKIIGRNIAHYRKVVGLTQPQLAEKVGVSPAFISRVECGKKTMKVFTLYRFAQALQVSCDALLQRESADAKLANINLLLMGQSDDYLTGIEKMIRVCIEEFQAKDANLIDL